MREGWAGEKFVLISTQFGTAAKTKAKHEYWDIQNK